MSKDWEPVWDAQAGWRISFTINGQRIRRRLGIRDKSQRQIARDAAKQIWESHWRDNLTPQVKQAMPFYRAAKGYIEAGFDATYLPKLILYFGQHTTIEDISDPEIIAAGLDLYPNAKPDTRRRQVKVPVNAVIRWAKGERRQASTDTVRTRWLTPEEAERLLQAAANLTLPNHPLPERYTLAKIAALLGSGMRTGECFSALVENWNDATNQLWLPGEEIGAGKTNSAARWVRLPDRAVELMGELPSEGRMFRTPYGREIMMRVKGGGQMQTAFNKARDMAGLGSDVTPHVLRHTWATWFYSQTKDFGGLMDLGGWAKAETANRYRKLAPDDLPYRLLAHGWDFRQEFDNSVRNSGLRLVNKQ